MKAILNLCCAASFACVLLMAVSGFDLSLPASVARKTTPGASRNVPPPATEFGSRARTKVMQYFDTYRTDPLGLPPDCAAEINLREIPASWRTPGIVRGKVVGEGDRSALVEAPVELVRVLPALQPKASYFLAGDYLVAVDRGYKIVDSIRIPTIHLPPGELTESPKPDQLVRHLDRSY